MSSNILKTLSLVGLAHLKRKKMLEINLLQVSKNDDEERCF